MKHKLMTIFLALMMFSLSYGVVYAEQIELIYDGQKHLYDFMEIGVYVDNVKVETNTMFPVQMNGGVLVPMEEVLAQLGIVATWKEAEQCAYIDYDNTLIVLGINQNTVWVNGEIKSLSQQAKLVNGTVMIPVRLISEILDNKVIWSSEEKSVYIESKAFTAAKDLIDQMSSTSNDTSTESNQDILNNNNQNIYVNDNQGNYGGNVDNNLGNVIQDTDSNTTAGLTNVAPEGGVSLSDYVRYDSQAGTVILDNKMGISPGSITVTEDCVSRTLVVNLPNVYSDVFPAGSWQINDNIIKSIEVRHLSWTQIVITTQTVKALNIYEANGQICLGCVAPKEKYSKIVVLDPGHGYQDNGTSYGSLYEKDLNLKLGKTLYNLLEQDANIKVYITRDDDSFLTLSERTTLANEINPDLFISIHINSATTASAKGTETYYTSKTDMRNKVFAEMVQEALVAAFGTTNRGVKNNTFVVTRDTNSPAILTEIGFISNDSDRAMMLQSDFYSKYAQAVYQCVLEYYNQGLESSVITK